MEIYFYGTEEIRENILKYFEILLMYITQAQNRYRIQQMRIYKRLLSVKTEKESVECGEYRT